MAGVGGEIEVGSVAVAIVPSAKGFLAKLLQQVGPDVAKFAKTVGESIEREIADSIADGAEKGFSDASKRAGREGAAAGRNFGAGFAASAKAALEAAERALGDFHITGHLDLDGAQEILEEVAAIQAAIRTLTDAHVNAEIDDAQFFAEIARMQAVIAVLNRRAIKLGVDTGPLASAAALLDGFGNSVRRNIKDSDTALDGFAGRLKKFAREAGSKIGIRVGLEADDVYPELARIKAEFADIHAKIGVEYDDNEAFTRIQALAARLQELERKRTVNFGVNEDFRTLSALVNKFIGDVGQGNARLEGMSATLRKIAQQAQTKISIRPELQNDEVYRELAELKANLSRIVASIGITLSPTEAYNQMRLIEARLKVLTRKRSIDVGVNREVADVARVFEGLDGKINQATDAAGGFLSQLGKMTPLAAAMNLAFVALFGALPAIIAVVASALAGLLGILTVIGGLLVTLGLGIGVLVLALTPIIAAIQAQKNATKQAAQATLEMAQAEQTALSNKLALANADEAIASAERSLARARINATRQATQAARTLAGAQRNLVNANDKEKEARKNLTTAYKDARNDLKKLNEEIRKNRIEQQSANVAVDRAREALAAAYADPTSSSTDIAAAQAAYNQAEQKIRDLKAEQDKNLTEKAKYDAGGLDANAGVISAQKELKSAIESVKDATDAQKNAAESAAQAQIDAATSIDDAERALAKARTDRANTVRQQQLAATTAQAQKDVSSADENDPLSKLTKKGLEFVTFYETKIKPIFDKFFQTAQDSGVLKGIEDFFTAIQPAVAPLSGLITAVGAGLGDFFKQIGEFFASKEGTDFIAFLTREAPKGFQVLADIAKGGLGFFFKMLEKFGPVMEKLAPALIDGLAAAGDILLDFMDSDDFQELVKTMIDNMPVLITFVTNLLVMLLKLIPVFAPLGQVILETLNYFIEGFNAIPTDFIVTILGIVLTVIGVLVAIFAGPFLAVVGGIIAAITGIALVVSYVYTHWEEIWTAIVDFFSGIWDDIQQILGAAIPRVIRFFTDLGDDIERIWSEAIDAVVEFFRGLWTDIENIAGIAIDNVTGFFTGLWEDIQHAFRVGVDAVGRIWTGLQRLIAIPIAGVIMLINDGIIDPFNTVVGYFGGDGVNRIKTPEWVQQNATAGVAALRSVFATGGIVGRGVQTSMRDEVPAMLRRGEAVMVPEAVAQIGPSTILDWNRRALLGQSIRRFAYGGLVDEIVSFERKSGVPFNVTSGVRNTNDYHGRGMAVDTASSAESMVRLASWLYGYSPYLLELIHSGGAGYFVKNGARKGSGFYGAKTVSQHFNHVHTAMNRAGLNAVQAGVTPQEATAAQGTEEPSGLAAWALGKIRGALDPLVSGFTEKFGDNKLAQTLVMTPAKLLGDVTRWLIEKAKNLGSDVINGLGDVGNFLKDLFTGNKDEKGKFAHDKGIEASPILAAGYAKSLLGQFGWDSGDMANLAKLWNGESGWRFNARNPSSGAYGIPQALPATKMASVGSDWAINAFTQVLWGMGYIQDRYGDPSNAYQKWLSRVPHWYDTGGYLPPGLTLAYNGTGRHERVMTHEQEQAMLRERQMLLRGRADVNIRVHDGAVTGLVSAEVDRQFGMLADDFVYGGAQ